MKVVATVLTAMLAFMLSVSVPMPIEACCLPQAESCCKTSACNCHMSAPSKPVPASDMPAPAPATVHAPTEGLAPMWGGYLLRPNSRASYVAVTFAGASAGKMRLYTLTHAFLI